MRHLSYAMTILLLMFITFTSCKKNDKSSAPAEPLTVTHLSVNGDQVAADEIDFDKNALSLDIQFSGKVDAALLAAGISIAPDGPDMSFKVSGNIATLNLSELDLTETYTLTISSGRYGSNGETLKDDYSLELKGSANASGNDDDENNDNPPVVTLTTADDQLLEGQSTTLTADLDKEATQKVVVSLNFGGFADGGNDVDFSSDDKIVIEEGETSGSITLKATENSDVKGMEELNITIGDVEGATEASPQKATILISQVNDEALVLKGVLAVSGLDLPGTDGKAIHFLATEDIPDLSIYGYGVASNGDGSKGERYSFPEVSAKKGDNILITRDKDGTLSAYFGDCFSKFDKVYNITDSKERPTQNGNDAIELYKDGKVIEIFGDRSFASYQEGTYDMPWEYTGSWAYKDEDGRWIFGGVGCTSRDATQDNASSNCVYPLCN